MKAILNPNISLTNGLIGHWKMNGDANDSSINRYNGNATSVTYTTGKISQAVSLTTNTSNITITGLSSVFTQLGTYTVSCWIYPTILGTNRNIWNFGGVGSNRHNLNLSSTLLGFQRYNGTSYTARMSSTIFSINNWYHIVCVNNNGTLSLYVNTNTNGINSNQYAITDGSNNLYIGYPNGTTNGSGSFYGLIDDVRVYNRAISTAEIDAIYNHGRGNESTISESYNSDNTELRVNSLKPELVINNINGTTIRKNGMKVEIEARGIPQWI